MPHSTKKIFYLKKLKLTISKAHKLKHEFRSNKFKTVIVYILIKLFATLDPY